MAQDVTYRAELNYQNEITADEITVIFNGTTYTVPKDPDGDYGLAALTFSGPSVGKYPFCIARVSDTNYVYVNADVYNNHNPFTIKIIEDSVTTTECFEKAVQSATSPLIVEATFPPSAATSQSPSYLTQPASSILEAMFTRGVIVKDSNGVLYSVLSADHRSVTIGMAFYDSTTQRTNFETYMYSVKNGELRYPPESQA